MNAVKPIPFAGVCTNGQADIPKIIGPDIFARIVPLSVTEGSSVYSEEKAKLLRAEQERVKEVDSELQVTLESLNVMPAITRLKAQMKGGMGTGNVQLPDEVRQWNTKVREGEARESLDVLQQSLMSLKNEAKSELEQMGLLLDKEQHDCEGMRVTPFFFLLIDVLFKIWIRLF